MKNLLFTSFFGLLALLVTPLSHAEELAHSEYAIWTNALGPVLFTVPGSWDYKVREDKRMQVTTINISSGDEEFELMITIASEESVRFDINDPKKMSMVVKKSMEKMLPYSTEKVILLEPFGDKGNGYFARVHEKNSEEGKFEFMSHGAINNAGTFVIFSLLSEKEETQVLDDALYMVSHIAKLDQLPATSAGQRALD